MSWFKKKPVGHEHTWLELERFKKIIRETPYAVLEEDWETTICAECGARSERANGFYDYYDVWIEYAPSWRAKEKKVS